MFSPGTNLAQEYDELKPQDGEKTIHKNHPSSFADTELHTYLGGTSGQKIVLTGYMVRKTSLPLLSFELCSIADDMWFP